MQTEVRLLAAIGAAAVMGLAAPVTAQALPGEVKTFEGAGIFTNSRLYMGPVEGYVDKSISAPFTFLYTYRNFMGSDTILPGTVTISSPSLFSNTVSFTGQVGIDMTNPNSYSISLTNPSSIDYLSFSLDVDSAFPVEPGPVAVRPTSTLSYAGRRFAYSGIITAFSTGPNAAAVPEPATWVMMMAGVGVVGGALRRRRKSVARVTFA